MNGREPIARELPAPARACELPDRIAASGLEHELDAEGFALLPRFFEDAQVRALCAGFAAAAGGAALPAPASCGAGVTVPLAATWPGFLVHAQAALSRAVEPIAARWRAFLESAGEGGEAGGARARAAAAEGQAGAIAAEAFSHSHFVLLRAGERRPLRSAADDDAMRHPFLVVALLSEPGRDFTGGDVVLTERRPRMQSRAIVLPLRRGDAAIVAAGPRPCRGTRGTYRAHLRQAVGTVRSGARLGLWMRLDGPTP